MSPFDRVVSALQSRGSRRNGHDWQCPAHDDGKPSLSVTAAKDRVLLHCQAGCSVEDVVAALGLDMSDLFTADGKLGSGVETAHYDYTDEGGELLFQVVRFLPKDFRQRRPDGTGWVWNLNGTRRVPYRLPAVVQAVRDGRRVFVVEGEKDVHAIERAGGVATCNPGGAGKWRDEFSAYFTRADVVVVADLDKSGEGHAQQVAASIGKETRSVRIVAPAAGKDTADHLAAGHGLEDWAPFEPHGGTDHREHVRPDHREHVTEEAFERPTVRAAEVVARNVDWLWPDRVPLGMPTVFGGFPGVGKSTILYDLAARTTREGKAVLVVTAEDHLAAVLRPRLEAAGANLDLVHILIVPLTLPEGVELLSRLVRDLAAALVILDPLVAFIGDGINTHRDHHVRRVLAPLADLAENTGAAVVVVIHTNKGEGSEPLMRISGSIGFTGAARSVLLAAEDPNDDDRRILAVVKSNLARFPAPLAYRIVGVALDEEITTSKIEWLGEAPEVDVRALLGRQDPDERAAIDEATAFLVASGVQQQARPARDLEREAASLDIGEKTLQRARRRLKVPAWRDGFQAPYMWGPKPGSNLDTQPGQPHPVQVVHVGADLRKQAPTQPNLDNRNGFGEEVFREVFPGAEVIE